jgi:hypothetical protein
LPVGAILVVVLSCMATIYGLLRTSRYRQQKSDRNEGR